MVRRARLISAALALTCASACGPGDVPTSTELADTTVRAALGSDREWIRAETIRLVGTHAAAAYGDAIEAHLEDPSAMVQTAAVEALLRTGDRDVETVALQRLVSGSVEQRIQLVELIVRVGRQGFRNDVLGRALRDVSPRVRVAAMRHAVAANIRLGAAELERLLTADEADVATEALRTLAHFDEDAALDFVLTSLRSSNPLTRSRTLSLARHVPTPSLWPVMRHIALDDPTSAASRQALIVLGHLGDPLAEESLRAIVLGTDADAAAEALLALGRIPTERATDQALVHRRDARPAVRRAAFEVLVEQNRPADTFDLFLEDADPLLARDALLHVLRADPARAAGRLSRALENARNRTTTLSALYRASLEADLRPVLVAAAPLLQEDLQSGDEDAAGLAVRLLAGASSLDAVLVEALASGSEHALYGMIEAALRAPDGHSDLFARGLESDVHVTRVAASLGVIALGDDYAPAGVTPEG